MGSNPAKPTGCRLMTLVALCLKSVGGYRKTSEADCELLSAQPITVSRNGPRDCAPVNHISPEGGRCSEGAPRTSLHTELCFSNCTNQ